MSLHEALTEESKRLTGWRNLLDLAIVLGTASMMVVLMAALDRFYPLREAWAFWFSGGAGILLFGVVLLRWMYSWRHRPDSRQLAERIEQRHPELLDTVNCAVDLQRSGRTQFNALEERVLTDAEIHWKRLDAEAALSPFANYRKRTLLGALASVCFALICFQTTPLRKVGYFLGDIIQGQFSGLHVIPGSEAIPVASDVTVKAVINRWRNEAFIEYRVEGPTEREAMRRTREGLQFVFYRIEKPTHYRVVTPSLASPWYLLSPYTPPRLSSVEWKVSPPTYTHLPEATFSEFETLRIVEGTEISVHMEVEPEGTRATLFHDASQIPAHGEAALQAKWGPPASSAVHIELVDPEGRKWISPTLRIEVTEDEEPIVEITAPGEDISAYADEVVTIEAYAADDFGLAQGELYFRIGDNDTRLAQNPTPAAALSVALKEQRMLFTIDLAALSANAGEVVTYYVSVRDNREPESQIAYSEVYFIEVVKAKQPGEQPDGESSDSGNMQGIVRELDVRGMIVETKAIIRLIYAANWAPQEERDENRRTIELRALNLRQTMTRSFAEVEGGLEVIDDIDTRELFRRAIDHIESTEKHISANSLTPAVDSADLALRKLVLLNQLLAKKERQMPGQMSQTGRSDSSQSSGNGNEQQRGQEGETVAERLEKLAELRDTVEDLHKRQLNNNSRISRAAHKRATDQENQQAVVEQEAIRAESLQARKDLYELTGSLAFTLDLENAATEMEGVSRNMRTKEPDLAEGHAVRAAASLAASVEAIETSMYDFASQIMEALESQARSAAEAQEGLSQDTAKANPGEGMSLKQRQDELNRTLSGLLGAMDQTGRDLDALEGDTGDELVKLGRQMRQEGIEGSGKRAGNALLYEAYARALREQNQVANGLDDMAEQLRALNGMLATESPQALQRAINMLNLAAGALDRLPNEDRKTLKGKVAEDLERWGLALSEQRLAQSANQLRLLREGPSPSTNSGYAQVSQVLSDALGVLQEHLLQRERKRIVSRNRESAPPPRRYRRQVEEYFRRLAEGSD